MEIRKNGVVLENRQKSEVRGAHFDSEVVVNVGGQVWVRLVQNIDVRSTGHIPDADATQFENVVHTYFQRQRSGGHFSKTKNYAAHAPTEIPRCLPPFGGRPDVTRVCQRPAFDLVAAPTLQRDPLGPVESVGGTRERRPIRAENGRKNGVKNSDGEV